MKCRAMTRIMQICMVLVVMVSAFFYIPMDVSASENLVAIVNTDIIDEMSESETVELSVPAIATAGRYYLADGYAEFGSVSFGDNLEDDKIYALDLSINMSLVSSASVYSRNVALYHFDGDNPEQTRPTFGYSTSVLGFWRIPSSGSDVSKNHSYTGNNIYYLSGERLKNFDLDVSYLVFSSSSLSNVSLTFNLNYTINSLTPLSSTDSEEYQNGYNAGYSAGEQAGYGSGYSNGFADGEASVDTDKIYDEAFQAGKDSVDTQSYYDAGYQAGYQVAYSEGYESGYDEGYQSAMDRIDGWGADMANYPLLVEDYLTDSFSNIGFVDQPYPRDLVLNYWVYLPVDYNPSHTYKFILDFNNLRLYRNSAVDYVYHSDITINSHIGPGYYPIRGNTDSYDVYYISGDRISDTIEVLWTMHNARVDDAEEAGEVGFKFDSLNIKIYDMGPSGDTQNHIANQTDRLTNGYDSSGGQAVNDDFKASVNEYHTAEDSLFSAATSSLENFTFLDFTSITGMVTSLSFVTSIMTSIYIAMGGDTGASGIILAVLFSVMLVSMAIGLYRYYVSNGKSYGGGKGGD